MSTDPPKREANDAQHSPAMSGHPSTQTAAASAPKEQISSNMRKSIVVKI
jgi:hypothetical protein